MEKEMRMYFRQALNARLRDLVPGIRGLLSSLKESDHPEPMDEVDLTSNRYATELALHIQYRNRQQVIAIVEALHRIDEGEFGICEECGGDIAVERLKVQPTTTVCIDCKKEREIHERLKVA